MSPPRSIIRRERYVQCVRISVSSFYERKYVFIFSIHSSVLTTTYLSTMGTEYRVCLNDSTRHKFRI